LKCGKSTFSWIARKDEAVPNRRDLLEGSMHPIKAALIRSLHGNRILRSWIFLLGSKSWRDRAAQDMSNSSAEQMVRGGKYAEIGGDRIQPRRLCL
jgi:hypothetical protein